MPRQPLPQPGWAGVVVAASKSTISPGLTFQNPSFSLLYLQIHFYVKEHLELICCFPSSGLHPVTWVAWVVNDSARQREQNPRGIKVFCAVLADQLDAVPLFPAKQESCCISHVGAAFTNEGGLPWVLLQQRFCIFWVFSWNEKKWWKNTSIAFPEPVCCVFSDCGIIICAN